MRFSNCARNPIVHTVHVTAFRQQQLAAKHYMRLSLMSQFRGVPERDVNGRRERTADDAVLYFHKIQSP